jgi:uncharacterized membrane protein YgcG
MSVPIAAVLWPLTDLVLVTAFSVIILIGVYNAPRREQTPYLKQPIVGRSQKCVIFAVDIAGFGHHMRDDQVQLVIRCVLYDLLRAAFDTVGINWDWCLHEDRGDGVLVIIPAQLPANVVIDPLVAHLQADLRRHNRRSRTVTRFRLRVAVHIGEVHRDQHGVAGTSLIHLFRLLESPVLKDALADGESDLALIVSDDVYTKVLPSSSGLINPMTFHAVIATVKETTARAWLHLPACPNPAPLAWTLVGQPTRVCRSRQGPGSSNQRSRSMSSGSAAAGPSAASGRRAVRMPSAVRR